MYRPDKRRKICTAQPVQFQFYEYIFLYEYAHWKQYRTTNSRQTAHLHVLQNDAGKTVKIFVYVLYKQLLCSIKEAGLEIPCHSIDIALFALRYYNASTLVMNTKVPSIQISGKGVLRIEESCICKCFSTIFVHISHSILFSCFHPSFHHLAKIQRYRAFVPFISP